MINENGLLSAVLYDRKAYEAVAEHVDPELELSAHGGEVWQAIARYYKLDKQAKACDPKTIATRLARKMPNHADTFREIIKGLSPELGSTNVAREVLELQRAAAGEALMVAVASSKPPDEVRPLVEKYQRINDASGLLDAGGGSMFDTPLSEVIKKAENQKNRIKVLPKELNKYLRGGVLPGHCIVLFGRVNVGKSTMAIHNTAGFLRQGKRVLFIENEDLLEDTVVSLGLRLVGCTRDWARDNPERYEAIAKKRGFDNLLIPDPAPQTIADVDRLLGDTGPDICVVNQARNLVRGQKEVVSQLDAVAKQLREIGKRRRIVMLLVTAATEGEKDRTGKVLEKPILQKADCYSSRTGFPAAADVMWGFGTSSTLEERGMRCISMCKNKLGSFEGETEPVLYVNVDFERKIIT